MRWGVVRRRFGRDGDRVTGHTVTQIPLQRNITEYVTSVYSLQIGRVP